MNKANEKKVHFSFEYNDGSEWCFDGTFEGKDHEIAANVYMVCRGTLMVSGANKSTAYNEEGFPICSYIK